MTLPRTVGFVARTKAGQTLPCARPGSRVRCVNCAPWQHMGMATCEQYSPNSEAARLGQQVNCDHTTVARNGSHCVKAFNTHQEVITFNVS